jgi:WXG100 family type VII secretion target
MAKANVDPADLRRFAQDLTRFTNELETLLSGLNGRLHALESTWRDQEQRKFEEAFNATLKTFGRFSEAAREHISFLGKKATLVEDYLKQR